MPLDVSVTYNTAGLLDFLCFLLLDGRVNLFIASHYQVLCLFGVVCNVEDSK